MSRSTSAVSRRWIRPVALLTALLGVFAGLGAWKYGATREANAAAASQPEPSETVTAAVATERPHQQTTTAIGTVLALRSISLRNELAGTVRHVRLTPGQVVDEGTVLVALDVSVEEAELRALEAQAALAQTLLGRTERMAERKAASQIELDNARAERDIALAQIARTKAIIARKTIRAPFRARVGISDVHVGQFLETGTQLTTLQGVDDAVNVDFSVAQSVAATLEVGQPVQVAGASDAAPITARISAIDARVDPSTRNAAVRARIDDAHLAPAPGASVRVQVPVGPQRMAVIVPASALRKGPDGDHVFVLAPGKDGKTRAQSRKVTAGPALGDDIVILDGISAGERVAASGSFKLREAALVVIGDSARTPNVLSSR
jgi:membrane fusion protein, multidrug efflux system